MQVTGRAQTWLSPHVTCHSHDNLCRPPMVSPRRTRGSEYNKRIPRPKVLSRAAFRPVKSEKPTTVCGDLAFSFNHHEKPAVLTRRPFSPRPSDQVPTRPCGPSWDRESLRKPPSLTRAPFRVVKSDKEVTRPESPRLSYCVMEGERLHEVHVLVDAGSP